MLIYKNVLLKVLPEAIIILTKKGKNIEISETNLKKVTILDDFLAYLKNLNICN